MRMYIYIYIYIDIFAGPLAQRRDRSVLFFVLVCYTPFIPQGTLGPRSRPTWALLGHYSGAPWICSRVPEPRGAPKGTPRTLQGRPREPPGPSQSSQGPPIEPPGCPGTNLALTKGPPGCPKYHSRAPLSWKYNKKQWFFNVFQSAQGAPKDP